MIKVGYKKLSSGPLLIYSCDPRKNQTYMEISVKFGGATKKFKYEGKEYFIEDGLAHLLEHTLIEDSMYGNISNYARDNFMTYNGQTSEKSTMFYFSVVKDHMRHLEELIRFVNTPVFKEESLEYIKKPIMAEIKRVNDAPYRTMHNLIHESTLGRDGFKSVIGTTEGVSSITCETLSLVYSLFYQPQNQIIYLSGKFDIDEVINKIEELYKEINKPKLEYEVLDNPITIEFKENNLHVVDPKYDEVASVSYKLDMSKFTPKEAVKMSFYLSYFLKFNFSDISNTYKKVKDMNLSTYYINVSYNDLAKNIVNIEMSLSTKKKDEFFKLVTDTLEEKNVYPEYFDLWKKEKLMMVLAREGSVNSIGQTYYDNIVTYDYYEKDKIEDIEAFSIEDLKACLELVEFNNPMFAYQTKE